MRDDTDKKQDTGSLRELIARLGLIIHPRVEANVSTVATNPPPRNEPSQLRRLGRYPVTGRLGAGGMGDVLQVHDLDIGRELAAKVIRGEADSKALAKFILEAQITGQLEHPNVVPNGFGLYDVIGNLYEWCRDPFLTTAYKLPPRMPDGWRNYPAETFKDARINRGGGWTNTAIFARPAYRYRSAPSARGINLGCRPARTIH